MGDRRKRVTYKGKKLFIDWINILTTSERKENNPVKGDLSFGCLNIILCNRPFYLDGSGFLQYQLSKSAEKELILRN